MVRVNLAAADADFDALPAGRYLVKVTGGELKETGENSKKPGTPMINWEFTVQDGDFEGRKLWTNTLLEAVSDSGAELRAIATLLKVTGAATDEDMNSADFELDIDDVIGKDLVAVVSQREYQGEMRNDIKRFRPAGDVASTEAALLP